MYNAYKYKKDQEKLLAEKNGVRPLKEKNPEAASKKLNVLANKAKIRRDTFINRCDLEENEFESKLIFFYLILFVYLVLNNGGNDSLAFKTSFYDFRGERGRDKSLDISP